MTRARPQGWCTGRPTVSSWSRGFCRVAVALLGAALRSCAMLIHTLHQQPAVRMDQHTRQQAHERLVCISRKPGTCSAQLHSSQLGRPHQPAISHRAA